MKPWLFPTAVPSCSALCVLLSLHHFGGTPGARPEALEAILSGLALWTKVCPHGMSRPCGVYQGDMGTPQVVLLGAAGPEAKLP